jgi:hypothetical protein
MLYIPPTQNPFLAQSMSMLQNIGMMYLGHQLKQQDTEKQQAYQEDLKKQELETKLVLSGYRPKSPTEQMGDVGNGPPSENEITLPKVGTWSKRESKPPKMIQLDIGDGRTLPVIQDEDGKWKAVTEALKTPSSQKPSAFVEKYLVAKSQGYTGDIMQFQGDLYKMAAKANPSATPKDPNSQFKQKKYIDQKTNKYMAQDMVFNPKTKAYEEAKDKDGNVIPPYEIPKTFDLMGALLGGQGNQGADAQMDNLNKQIEALQNALKEE